jgi:hypothetical protein
MSGLDPFNYGPRPLLGRRVNQRMNIQAYLATVGAAALSLVAYAGCTVNSTTNNNETDAATGTMDSSTGAVDDTGTTDTGTAAVVDTGTLPVSDASEAGEAAATCSLALDTGVAACDTCVGSSCCTPLTNCATPDDAGSDDAGNSACLQLLFCINDINNSSDAGVDSGAGETACNSSYSASEQAAAQAVLSCIRASCAAQCPGL